MFPFPIQGIYRVSGVKSTVENLCQRFEMDPESVDLEAENPNVISNVLKLYLRQLPEPLLTFKLYPNFINVAKVSSFFFFLLISVMFCDDCIWLVVLGFNATLTAKFISWRSVMHMCFLAFLHQF